MCDTTKSGDLKPVKFEIAPIDTAVVTKMNPNGMTKVAPDDDLIQKLSKIEKMIKAIVEKSK